MKNATRVFASTFGAIMALAGIEHGIGEILQGNVAPAGLMILSWPDAEFFRNLSGEPAMTIIPNLLITGIFAVLISLALLIWSVWFVDRKSGSLVMILLSIAMLLFGGGIFPPIFAVIIGIVATRIQSPLTWWRDHISNRFRGYPAKFWPWFYAVCIIAWFALLVGPGILGYYFGIDSEFIVLMLMGFAFGLFILTLFSGFARDALRQSEPGARSFTTPSI